METIKNTFKDEVAEEWISLQIIGVWLRLSYIPEFIFMNVWNNYIEKGCASIHNKKPLFRIENKIPTSVKSKHPGVTLVSKKYVARIIINGKNIYIGSYDYQIDAINAYDKALSENKIKLII